MSTLTPDQRNYYYLREAERAGIHKPILAALYEAQGQPAVNNGETGLGISPANRIPLEAVDTFAKQVYYAANTISSLIGQLVAKGWAGSELWNSEKGRYTDLFIKTVAAGYVPASGETDAGRLESCKAYVLLQSYLKDLERDLAASALPQSLEYLDRSLLALVEEIPYFYYGLSHQREAMLEAVRLWVRVDTREAAIACLEDAKEQGSGGAKIQNLDESQLDIPLKQFLQNLAPTYASYPYQREALIRLAQLWRQLPSREAAIASLEKDTSPETSLSVLDPALIAFIQRLPQSGIPSGLQRQALTELFQSWYSLDSRTAALQVLGIATESLARSMANRKKLAHIAVQLDRELREFIRRLPTEYKQLDDQRSALIGFVQVWRGLTSKHQTIQSLLDDLKRMEKARRDAQDAPPVPLPLTFPSRPEQWTTQNICLSAAIVADGNFTWAEATQGGMWMPPDQETVDAIVRIASLVQRARDRIARPLLVSSWYLPPNIYQTFRGVLDNRHILGDALTFTCEGLSGNQLYWFLDPWWPGGLGRYTKFANLCHIDARSYRARWEY